MSALGLNTGIKGSLGYLAVKLWYPRLKLRSAGQVTDCVNISQPAFGSRKSELLIFWMYLNFGLQWRLEFERNVSVCAVYNWASVFCASLKITGAVVLPEGLFGGVEFPELLEKEQLGSVLTWVAVLYFWSQRLHHLYDKVACTS